MTTKPATSPIGRSLLLATFVLVTNVIISSQASGVFEINLSALTDAYGRDLRLDCCAWQNSSAAQHQQAAQHLNHLQSQLLGAVDKQQQQQPASCDPTKCQLIIRICVKNYQTQIDPSHCTFGELSAQVIKPNDPYHYLLAPAAAAAAASSSSAASLNPYKRYQQQQQLTSSINKNKPPVRADSMLTNYHHQRLLLQASEQQQQHARLYSQQQASLMPAGVGGHPRALRSVAFNQPISFPFNFTWPGAFSLVLDAWYESPTGLQQVIASQLVGPSQQQEQQQQQQQQQQQRNQQLHFAGHHHRAHNHLHLHPLAAGLQQQQHQATSYDLYMKQLIIQHSMHGWLTVKNEWTNGIHRTDAATLIYSYRVTCQRNYYGEQCNILCKPHDDVYGHFTCSDLGEIVCMDGWQGTYCEAPICLPGCNKEQGNCTRPNECQCRPGWQGPSCEQCVRFPGCVHGSCNKPHQCICQEGWKGLLCNEEVSTNYCADHQPCKNGGVCSNNHHENADDPYTCVCDDNFVGKNCELEAKVMASSLQNVTTIHSSAPKSAQAIGQQSQQSGQQSSGSNGPYAHKLAKHANQPGSNIGLIPTNAQSFTSAAAQPSMIGPHMFQQQSLDHRVMVAYGVIIVCMVILVVLLLLRVFFERISGAVVVDHRTGQPSAASSCADIVNGSNSSIWSTATDHYARHYQQHGSSRRHHHGHRHKHHSSRYDRKSSHHGPDGPADDVATLQNHQNIYKSRTSLSTDKVNPFASDSADHNTTIATSECSSSVTSSSCFDSDHPGSRPNLAHNDSTYQHYNPLHTTQSLASSHYYMSGSGGRRGQQQTYSSNYRPLTTSYSYHNLAAAPPLPPPQSSSAAAIVASHLQQQHHHFQRSSRHAASTATLLRDQYSHHPDYGQHPLNRPPPPPYTIAAAGRPPGTTSAGTSLYNYAPGVANAGGSSLASTAYGSIYHQGPPPASLVAVATATHHAPIYGNAASVQQESSAEPGAQDTLGDSGSGDTSDNVNSNSTQEEERDEQQQSSSEQTSNANEINGENNNSGNGSSSNNNQGQQVGNIPAAYQSPYYVIYHIL